MRINYCKSHFTKHLRSNIRIYRIDLVLMIIYTCIANISNGKYEDFRTVQYNIHLIGGTPEESETILAENGCYQ